MRVILFVNLFYFELFVSFPQNSSTVFDLIVIYDDFPEFTFDLIVQINGFIELEIVPFDCLHFDQCIQS